MADFGDIPSSRLITPAGNQTLAAMQEVGKEKAESIQAAVATSRESLLQAQETAINPYAAALKTTRVPIKSHAQRVKKQQEAGKGKRLLPIEELKDQAQKFQKERRNPELRPDALVLLRQYIKQGDKKSDILRKIREYYPDPTLADDALDFLILTSFSTSDGDLQTEAREAKTEFLEQFSREINAGRNINAAAQQASQKGLGTPSNLRDLYRNITNEPRESKELFDELSKKYEFKDLKKVIDFLLHSLGADIKKNMESPQLHRLFTEVRSLQAILGIYRFFRGRMNLTQMLFKANKLEMPQQLSFELMAKQFMSFAAERYPTEDHVLQAISRMGIGNSPNAALIIITQFLAAVREVSLYQIYKTPEQRDQSHSAIVTAGEIKQNEADDLFDEQTRQDSINEDEDDNSKKDDIWQSATKG